MDAHSISAQTQELMRAAREGGAAAAALLREAGCRPTPQRMLVLAALGEGGHASAEEILAHARARYPSINPSTVYRTLEALVAAGIAERTDLQAGRWHFELARSHRHHHAVCQGCGAIAHFHDAALAPLGQALLEETGFALGAEHVLTIPAICPECRKEPTLARLAEDGAS